MGQRGQGEREEAVLSAPPEQQGRQEVLNGALPVPNDIVISERTHDMSWANLLTLVEVAASSATIREKTALDEVQRLEKRDIQGVSVKEMADVMRSSELTYNVHPDKLLNAILAKPGEPINNIFHLKEKGIKPKGDVYLTERDDVEKKIFPELEGHEVKGDERPIYGALNVIKDPLGAAMAGYGAACIVFKPSVAKRSTFIADDTFYSPRISITPERKALFYSKLDEFPLSKDLRNALKDENSKEHKEVEAWLDSRNILPNATIHALEEIPPSMYRLLQGDDRHYVNILFAQCFIDKEATRNNMATYDNLESLVVNMGDINGNALANAALKNRQGGEGRVGLTGIQYIEAQIHGPVIPSRDIAEIRINAESLPGNSKEERAESRRKLEEFGRKNGVKITLVENYSNKITNNIAAINTEQETFNNAHVDTQKLRALRQEYLNNFEKHVQDAISLDLHMASQMAALPQGMLPLKGEALDKAKEIFDQNLSQYINERVGGSEPIDIVKHALTDALASVNVDSRIQCLKDIAEASWPLSLKRRSRRSSHG